jgi:hypothetical protein
VTAAMPDSEIDFSDIPPSPDDAEWTRPGIEMRVPNKLTAKTLAKSERGEDLRRVDSADALFKDLGI